MASGARDLLQFTRVFLEVGALGRSEHASGADSSAEAPSVNVSSGEILTSQLIGELIGLLAHDLRNPLSALHSNLGYLDAVLGSEAGEAREAVEDGVVSCDGLSHVIDNVDLLGQVLRGGLHVQRGPSPVAALLASAVERCQAAARSHGLTLELDAKARHLHAVVDVGRDLATRALTNLIRNSIQHAPPATTVLVTAAIDGARVVVQIRDGGTRLADDDWAQAFTAAGQVAAKHRSHSRYSRGMGLFSAQLAAQLCGCEVGVFTQAEGNVFQMTLPQATQR